jgi:hypothetical protein
MFGLSLKTVAVHAAIAIVAVAIAKRVPFTAQYL